MQSIGRFPEGQIRAMAEIRDELSTFVRCQLATARSRTKGSKGNKEHGTDPERRHHEGRLS